MDSKANYAHAEVKQHCQRGLSLIELMIAMTLGVILLSGIIQVFLSSKQSYGLVMGQSQVLDNGRLAQHFIADAIRKSGYWSDGWNRRYGSDIGLSSGGYAGVFDASQYLWGRDNDATDASVVDGSDQLFLRYNGDDDDSVANCIGQSIVASQLAIERYYLRAPGAGEGEASLVCETIVLNIDQASGDIVGSATSVLRTQPLISGIESMQFLFGERDGAGLRRQYRTASDVVDWRLVEDVRVAMLVASAEGAKTAASSEDYQLLDQTITSANDRRVRRVFSQVIASRNPNLGAY